MRGSFLALILTALPVQAMAQGGPWVDLEQVMAAHADQVTTVTAADGTPAERLDMGDGVVIECTGVGATRACEVNETGDIQEIGCSFIVVA